MHTLEEARSHNFRTRMQCQHNHAEATNKMQTKKFSTRMQWQQTLAEETIKMQTLELGGADNIDNIYAAYSEARMTQHREHAAYSEARGPQHRQHEAYSEEFRRNNAEVTWRMKSNQKQAERSESARLL